MKKSRAIALTLMASACIMASACSSDQKTKRDVYASRNDCENDWGGGECESAAEGGGYHGPHYYFSSGRAWYYPRGQESAIETRPTQGAYHLTPDSHSSRAVSSFASARTSRGGFGASSLFHGGGS